MKLQWRGRRRTLRLTGTDRSTAAREAAAVYLEVRQGGWAAFDRRRDSPPATAILLPASHAAVADVGPRKYVSNLNPGFARELFVSLTWGGITEHLSLGTEALHEAQVRALDLKSELRRDGWARMKLSYSREATVAVFWQANPMACTYTTLLTIPAQHGIPQRSHSERHGWRALVIEPDGGVRRALAHWLGTHPAMGSVETFAAASEAQGRRNWDLILANRDQPATGLRSLVGNPASPPPWMLTHGVFADSDAIFASFSGVSLGYLLRRVPPSELLAPILGGFREGPPRSAGEADRQIRKYFRALFDPAGVRSEVQHADLTSRELEILDLLSRGFADKEIAPELGISVWTVHSHLKRIFAKYGVRTRTEAVVRHLQK
jgi:DNA-binding NarL/FixJ family response regulator